MQSINSLQKIYIVFCLDISGYFRDFFVCTSTAINQKPKKKTTNKWHRLDEMIMIFAFGFVRKKKCSEIKNSYLRQTDCG